MFINLPQVRNSVTSLLASIRNLIDTKLDRTENAVSATRLKEPFALTIGGGDAVGQVEVQGDSDVTLEMALVDTGVSPGVFSKVTVDAKGRVTAGTALVIADIPTLPISKTSGLQSTLDNKLGAADTAVKALASDKWTTPRTLTLTGGAEGSVTFDGSDDITMTVAVSGSGLEDSGVVPGTYPRVTVNEKGQVTAGSTLTPSDIPLLEISHINQLQNALNQSSSILPGDTLYGDLKGNGYTYQAFYPRYVDHGNVYTSFTVDVTEALVHRLAPKSALTISFKQTVFNYYTAGTFQILLEGAGDYAIIWPNNVYWDGGSPPQLAPGSQKTLLLFVSFDRGNKYYGTTIMSTIP